MRSPGLHSSALVKSRRATAPSARLAPQPGGRDGLTNASRVGALTHPVVEVAAVSFASGAAGAATVARQVRTMRSPAGSTGHGEARSNFFRLGRGPFTAKAATKVDDEQPPANKRVAVAAGALYLGLPRVEEHEPQHPRTVAEEVDALAVLKGLNPAPPDLDKASQAAPIGPLAYCQVVGGCRAGQRHAWCKSERSIRPLAVAPRGSVSASHTSAAKRRAGAMQSVTIGSLWSASTMLAARPLPKGRKNLRASPLSFCLWPSVRPVTGAAPVAAVLTPTVKRAAALARAKRRRCSSVAPRRRSATSFVAALAPGPP